MTIMAINIFLGIALAVATGFRIFLPMFFMSLASHAEWIAVPEKLSWLESDTALIVLGVAMVIELISYFIPGVDNIMDMIDTPIAVIAGLLVVFSVIQVDSMVEWILAIVIGGVLPAVMKAIKATLRGMLTVFTGGLGNGAFALFEAFASICIVVIAVFLLL